MRKITVRSSFFEKSGIRLDASYHLSEGVITKRKFEKPKYPIRELSEVSKNIFRGSIFKRTYVDNAEVGIPYLTASDMMKTDIKSGKFLSKKHTDVANLMLSKGWILVSCSGTLGNTVFTNELFEGVIGTHDLIRIIPNEEELPSGYLYAFLSSKYGYGLLTQSGYGGVVKHIEPHHIENLPVPIFPEEKQTEIHQLIVDAAALRVEANQLLEEAVEEIENHFNITLKSHKSQIQTGISSIQNLFNNEQKRLDSPTHLAQSKTVLTNREKEYLNIGELRFNVHRPGIFKRVKVSKGLPYLKGSELSKQNPFNGCEYLAKAQTPFLDELLLKENQILYTCAGSIGNTRLITKEFEEREAIGSQDIIRIEQSGSELSILYLFAFLNTKFSYDFIQSIKYGSVIERVEPFHVETIPVFIPKKEFENEIISKVKKYSSNLYSAFSKENQAISLIEKEIDLWQN